MCIMLRNLIKICGRSFISFSPKSVQRSGNQKQRFLCYRAALHNRETPAVNDGDTDYIVPYKLEYEKAGSYRMITESLRMNFFLSKDEIESILSNEIVLKICRERSLMEALDLLYVEGVKKENLVEYPWVITLERKDLMEKIAVLKSLNGFRDINDFIPFFHLNLSRIRKLVSSLNRESKDVDHGNRIYFVAELLKVPPATVTKYFAHRLFVLRMSLEMFKTNLQNMVNYNIEPLNILKDLWGFRYSPKSVEFRLKRASQAKKDKIMPWMVRCPEPILKKSLQISLDEIKILGDRASVAEYVGERLGFSPEEAQAIMNKHPQSNTVRITKIKDVLDYLLDEEKFTGYEIAQVPRLLCHSLETTKERIEELKKYGCRPTSLVIVCRSKKEYEKFLDQWRQHYKCNISNERVQQEKCE